MEALCRSVDFVEVDLPDPASRWEKLERCKKSRKFTLFGEEKRSEPDNPEGFDWKKLHKEEGTADGWVNLSFFIGCQAWRGWILYHMMLSEGWHWEPRELEQRYAVMNEESNFLLGKNKKDNPHPWSVLCLVSVCVCYTKSPETDRTARLTQEEGWIGPQ